MRDIKFKVWDKNNKCFVTNKNKKSETKLDYNSNQLLYWSNYILLQYTGLLDKNGKEIYEGDVIADRYHKGLVEWHDGIGAWSWPHGEDWGMIFAEDVEIIGNIYETPELLK